MEPILHSRPLITAADIAAVQELLAGHMIGQGERSRALETRCARWFGATDGAAAASGSAALHLALHALGAGPGTEVVIPTYVCRSVMEAVMSCGATPVPCDAGPEWQATPETVAARLTPRTKAVVVAHVMGIFADTAAIARLGVPVVEDFAQALPLEGARPLMGDIGVLSFHPTKCVTAGEGGVAVARGRAHAERMRAFRDGTTPPRARLFSPLSDIAATLALSQLDQYARFHARRVQLAEAYRAELAKVVPHALCAATFERGTRFRLPLSVDGGIARYRAPFAERGIHVRQGVDELLHRLLGLPDGDYPQALRHFERTVSLPLYPALSDTDLQRCLDAAGALFR